MSSNPPQAIADVIRIERFIADMMRVVLPIGCPPPAGNHHS